MKHARRALKRKPLKGPVLAASARSNTLTRCNQSLWKAPFRPRTQFKLQYLSEDLAYRRQKEFRLVHKLLRWPRFNGKGTITARARSPHSIEQLLQRLHDNNTPEKQYWYARSLNDPWTRGFEREVRRIRAAMIAKAVDLGVDMEKAKAFDAQEDMRRCVHVGMLSEDEVQVESYVWKRRGGPRGQSIIFCEGEVSVGREMICGRDRWVQLIDTKTKQVHLYQPIGTQFGDLHSKHESSLPPFVDRRMGWHNGSYKPKSYARTSTSGISSRQLAQVLEIQDLERRDRQLLAAFNKLTEHGHDMTWYGRSGVNLHRRAMPARRIIQRRWPTHVAAYEGASTLAQSSEIFGSFSANLWISSLLYPYFNDGQEQTANHYVHDDWRDRIKAFEPPEMQLVFAECHHGVHIDT